MLTNWRDPVSSFMNDFTSDVLDPFTGTLGDLLPKTRGGMSRRSNLLGLISLNACEVGNEFKIVAEVGMW
ncbi:hypothetical protein EON65_36695 [archaeon]|nr:MAG: hypothetical protein EON65_36695 [archaeon]